MQNHSNNVNSETQTVEIQVVLEYSWDSHRDLIANVQAEQIVNEATHEQGRIIDHLYLSPELINTIELKILFKYYSDHAALQIKFKN